METIRFIRKTGNSKEVLKVNKKNGVTFLTYPLLSQCGGFRHGFSTRLGGVSKGIFESMNLSFSRGDQAEAVMENFKRIADAIGFSHEAMVLSDQTHTTNVRVVTKKDAGSGIMRPKDFFETDGLITNEPGIVLTTFYADCVPLFFIDPVHKAIGLSHSGWRGTVGRMGEKTLQTMKREFGTKPEEVFAAIGPSICADCYEIGEDVASVFAKEFKENAEQILFPKGNGKYRLDLWKANEQILEQAGILPDRLAVTDICTCCNPKLLFSHRASNGQRGNLAAFLEICE
ncbi:MAG TPA: peptidoglycan editing factor PgeF [Lachnospiraceae bacterium]|nr:peptidoglycan editing factor PgeF [Lachnospiraceae bacterium]